MDRHHAVSPVVGGVGVASARARPCRGRSCTASHRPAPCDYWGICAFLYELPPINVGGSPVSCALMSGLSRGVCRWPLWVCACVSGTNLRGVLEAQLCVRHCLNCLDYSFSHHAAQHILPDQPGLRPLPTILHRAITPQHLLQLRHIPSHGRSLCASSMPMRCAPSYLPAPPSPTLLGGAPGSL